MRTGIGAALQRAGVDDEEGLFERAGELVTCMLGSCAPGMLAPVECAPFHRASRLIRLSPDELPR